MVEAGKPVGRGRSLVEDIRRRVATHLETALEDVVALPEFEDLELRFGKTSPRAHGRIPGHCLKDTGRSFAAELPSPLRLSLAEDRPADANHGRTLFDRDL